MSLGWRPSREEEIGAEVDEIEDRQPNGEEKLRTEIILNINLFLYVRQLYKYLMLLCARVAIEFFFSFVPRVRKKSGHEEREIQNGR